MGIEKGRKTALILGIDGYIGWPLAQHLRKLGYDTYGADNFFRRHNAESLIPLNDSRRIDIISSVYDITSLPEVDIIVHLAEQPSAPWSMKGEFQASRTQAENVIGTLKLLWLMKEKNPNAHLIKLGTMGEYGTPDCEIPEGFIGECLKNDFLMGKPVCPMDGLMFPRTPNSFYHLSKVFDSMNIDFACRTWGLKSTDIMQGIVFGHQDGTRLDYDEHFGTVINRFCVQAVAGIPLTVYGEGGQTRGYLPLKDSIECITRIIDNPPKKGEYRVFNQFARTYTINDLALAVKEAAKKFNINVEIQHIENPRTEAEKHFFMPKHDKLRELGYNPEWDLIDELEDLIEVIIPYKDKINKNVIYPTTKWSA